jgi:predicted RNA-binding protein YlqC (UPF0109 family)
MKDTLTYLVRGLVDQPEAISIEESQEEGKTILTLHVHPDDMGKIIGKGGRIIKAIRDLIKILAAKRNMYIDVVLAEDTPAQ